MATRGQFQNFRYTLQSTNTGGETQTAEADGRKSRHSDPSERILMANRPEETTNDQKRKTGTRTGRKRETRGATESSPTKGQPAT